MAGVPFRQIADWLGHQDGGVLVGKVYGHLILSLVRERLESHLLAHRSRRSSRSARSIGFSCLKVVGIPFTFAEATESWQKVAS
jgi:hypothetical protein